MREAVGVLDRLGVDDVLDVPEGTAPTEKVAVVLAVIDGVAEGVSERVPVREAVPVGEPVAVCV